MDNLYSKIFLKGDGVKSLLFHTVPPKKNMFSKFVSPLFIRLHTVFHFSKIAFLDDLQERIPGRPPGTRSWETSRKTLLK